MEHSLILYSLVFFISVGGNALAGSPSDANKVVEQHLKKKSHKKKFSFDIIIARLFNDASFDLIYENESIDPLLREESQENLRLILNTIYARKNYKFEEADLIEFYSKRFKKYKPTHETIEMSEIDYRNAGYLEGLLKNAHYRDNVAN